MRKPISPGLIQKLNTQMSDCDGRVSSQYRSGSLRGQLTRSAWRGPNFIAARLLDGPSMQRTCEALVLKPNAEPSAREADVPDPARLSHPPSPIPAH